MLSGACALLAASCRLHVLQARVPPTLEVVLVESPGYLRKTCDRQTALALLAIGA